MVCDLVMLLLLPLIFVLLRLEAVLFLEHGAQRYAVRRMDQPPQISERRSGEPVKYDTRSFGWELPERPLCRDPERIVDDHLDVFGQGTDHARCAAARRSAVHRGGNVMVSRSAVLLIRVTPLFGCASTDPLSSGDDGKGAGAPPCNHDGSTGYECLETTR